MLDHNDEYHVSKLMSLALADMFGIRGFPCPKKATCDSGAVLSEGDRMRLRLTILSGVASCLVQVPARKQPIQVSPTELLRATGQRQAPCLTSELRKVWANDAI